MCGLSNLYYLDASTFIVGESGIAFHFYFIFDEIPVSKQFCGVSSGVRDVRLIRVVYAFNLKFADKNLFSVL